MTKARQFGGDSIGNREVQGGEKENADVLFIKNRNHPRCQGISTDLGDLQELISVDRTRAIAISRWNHSWYIGGKVRRLVTGVGV